MKNIKALLNHKILEAECTNILEKLSDLIFDAHIALSNWDKALPMIFRVKDFIRDFEFIQDKIEVTNFLNNCLKYTRSRCY